MSGSVEMVIAQIVERLGGKIAVSPRTAAAALDMAPSSFYLHVLPHLRSLKSGRSRRVLVSSLIDWAETTADSESAAVRADGVTQREVSQ